MTRTFAVVLIAAICAGLFGVDRPSAAAQTAVPPQATGRQAIEARLAGIKVNSPVKVRRLDGTTVEGLLAEKRADDISVDVYRRRAFRRIQLVRRDIIPLSEIKDVRKILSDRQRAALAAGVSAGILLGTCAVALATYHASASPNANPSTDGQPTPAGSESAPDHSGVTAASS
jgi:hypothetical protein